MFMRGMTTCLVLAMATVAQADAVVTLSPDIAGPYLGGETVVVDVSVVQNTRTDLYLRLHQFDFGASDPTLSLNSFAFDWFGTQACRNFGFCVPGTNHEQFPSLTDADGPIVSAVFTASSESTLFQILLPGDGTSVVLGRITLTVPTTVGTYILDAVGDSPVLDFGFGPEENPILHWFRRPDDITGGTLSLEVIPEPVTFTLFALGGFIALRRRRGS